MNTIFAAGSRMSPPAGLEQGELLHQLHLMTGVRSEDWLALPNESPEQRAERLEFQADVILGIAEHDPDAARRVAELCRRLTGEPEASFENDRDFGTVPADTRPSLPASVPFPFTVALVSTFRKGKSIPAAVFTARGVQVA
ncbi:hypothetical protein [Streptomyces sp. NPDC059979]|uniref:hypothetical protein n=1 Tax=Streptomyces sp. NPDC059979 TaxID=3347021 RepID=UPI0036AB2140